MPFALTPRLYLRLIEQSGLRCAITGMPFSAVRLAGARKRLFAPSLDRMAPKRGYVEGNVRFTSVWANLARNDAEGGLRAMRFLRTGQSLAVVAPFDPGAWPEAMLDTLKRVPNAVDAEAERLDLAYEAYAAGAETVPA